MTKMTKSKLGVRARFVSVLNAFDEDESGATAIEYGLILSLIFIAIIGAVNTFADNTTSMYNSISENLTR